MAKCDFSQVKNVSGALTKRVAFEKGKKVTTRLVAKVVNGKQRLYLMNYKERSTPLSEAEIAARKRFYMVSQRIKNLTDEERQRYREDFVRSKYTFNGKRYATLRGWMVARFSAEYKE